METHAPRVSAERDWWLRAALVLQQPSLVFRALRNRSDDDEQARQEPLLAIIWLAGMGGVLWTNEAARVLDDFEIDTVAFLVWLFLAGGIHGIAAYFLVGALAYVGGKLVGADWSYRRARHVLGFAAVPIALSLAMWPVRLAAFGGDAFRTGGSDAGAGSTAFEALELVFLAWALALLVLGTRIVTGLGWPRAVVATAFPSAVAALILGRAYGLY